MRAAPLQHLTLQGRAQPPISVSARAKNANHARQLQEPQQQQRKQPQQQRQQQCVREAQAGPAPVGMTRAKHWSPEVEDAFRLQEAGFKGLPDLKGLGLDPPERWPESGFIRKLQTRESVEAGTRILLYFKKTAECEPRYLNRVKIYRYA